MNNKGLSKVVAIVFLVVLVIVAAVFLWSSVSETVQGGSSEIAGKASFECIKGLNMQVNDVCYKDGILKLILENKGEEPLGDFFLIQYFFADGTTESVPSPPKIFIEPRKTKTLLIEYKEGATKIRVFPPAEDQESFCSDYYQEVDNLQECEK